MIRPSLEDDRGLGFFYQLQRMLGNSLQMYDAVLDRIFTRKMCNVKSMYDFVRFIENNRSSSAANK